MSREHRAALLSDGSQAMQGWLEELGFEADAIHLSPPAECPWTWSGDAEPKDVAAELLSPWAGNMPEAVEALVAACHGLAVVSVHGTWLLMYGLVRKRSAILFAGGIPNPSVPVNAKASAANWKIPASLADFYAVHEGFGRLVSSQSFWFEECVLPPGALMPISVMMPPADDADFDPDDLLMISPDGGGNLRCFHRQNAAQADPPTVLWAAMDRSLTAQWDLWGYLNALFSDIEKL
jgi:hypothetical protein